MSLQSMQLRTRPKIKVVHVNRTNIPNVGTIDLIYMSPTDHLICARSMLPAPKCANRYVVLLDHEYLICSSHELLKININDIDYHNKIYPVMDNKLTFSRIEYDKSCSLYLGNNREIEFSNKDPYDYDVTRVHLVLSENIDSTYGIDVCHREFIFFTRYDSNTVNFLLHYCIMSMSNTVCKNNILVFLEAMYEITVQLEDLNSFIEMLFNSIAIYIDANNESCDTYNYSLKFQGHLINELCNYDLFGKYCFDMFSHKVLMMHSFKNKKIREYL